MKILSKDDIYKLAEEYQALDRWHQVKDFATKYYSAEATTVSIDTYPESDDEGGSYLRIDTVTVQDAEGHYLTEDEENDDFYDARCELPIEDAEYDLTKRPAITWTKVVVLEEGESVAKFLIGPANTTFLGGNFYQGVL